MKTILSIDDERDMEILLKLNFDKQINSGTYAFVFAHNGKEALNLLDQGKKFDLIITDLNMPEMNGIEFLTELHLRVAEDKQFKIIVISAYNDMDNIRQAMNCGAWDFITKPINLSDLEETIQRAFKPRNGDWKGMPDAIF